MGKKDLSEKLLEDYNDIFADIVNVLLFDGVRRIKESDLENVGVHSQYKEDNSGCLHEMERDVAKFWKRCGIKIALYGIENQTKVERKMPLRVFGYEGSSYRTQLNEKNNYPVVTLVLYFGTESRWNAPTSLKEVIDVPEYLSPYVNDIKINVFNIAWLPKETIAKFKSDFRVVAEFFSKKRNNEINRKDEQSIKHVDEVLKLLSAMTEDSRYEEIISSDKEVHNMCEVAERLEQIGLEKGLEKGRAEGLAEGREGLIKEMLCSGKAPEQIADFCGIELNEIKKVQKKIQDGLI